MILSRFTLPTTRFERTTKLVDENVQDIIDEAVSVISASSTIKTGPTGATGATGPSGVVSVSEPITNSGTSTSANIGLNQSALTLAQSQVTNLSTDLSSKANTTTLNSVLNNTATSVDTFNRAIATTTTGVVSGTIGFTFFTPNQNLTVSQVSMINVSANGGVTLARMGLYTFDGTTATLVARTASDTSLFNVANTLSTRSFDTTGGFPSTYNLVAGERYALGIIQVASSVASFSGITTNALMSSSAPRMTGSATSQTDLVTSRNTFTNIQQLFWARFS
jgi:hypothetical protein